MLLERNIVIVHFNWSPGDRMVASAHPGSEKSVSVSLQRYCCFRGGVANDHESST